MKRIIIPIKHLIRLKKSIMIKFLINQKKRMIQNLHQDKKVYKMRIIIIWLLINQKK